MADVNSRYASYSLNELGAFFSDYHKDVYGFRPQGVNFQDRGAILKGLKALDDWFELQLATPEGRAELERSGWVVPK